jgi:adenylate cyclase, class 2
MSFEIEKKYRLSDVERDRVRVSLVEAGAEFVRRDFEVNTIYSSPMLRQQGGVLRIRKIKDRTILTLKRRVENELDVKKQIEHETEVADANELEEIVAGLGLDPILIYEKYRDTWRFRSVEVVVDELPFGLYMEVEGTITGIKEAEILLDFEDLETEHETYPRLTARLGIKSGDLMEARFSREDRS